MSEKRADPISLRLPAELREKIDASAKLDGRSLNAEIRFRLERSYEADEAAGAPGFTQPDRIERLENEIENLRAVVRGLDARLNGLEDRR